MYMLLCLGADGCDGRMYLYETSMNWDVHLYKCMTKDISHGMIFPTMWYVRSVNAQTSLRVRAV